MRLHNFMETTQTWCKTLEIQGLNTEGITGNEYPNSNWGMNNGKHPPESKGANKQYTRSTVKHWRMKIGKAQQIG